ncbi:MAG: hypothetical protein ACREDT_09275 [Methylocella sp.]
MITRSVARDDAALLAERMKPLIQKGQPLWDKVIVASLVVLLAFWLFSMGLDAGRFRWSAMPALLQWLGATGMLISMWIWWIWFRTIQASPFLAIGRS